MHIESFKRKENLMENILYSLGPYKLNKSDYMELYYNVSFNKENIINRFKISILGCLAIYIIKFIISYNFNISHNWSSNLLSSLYFFIFLFLFLNLLPLLLTPIFLKSISKRKSPDIEYLIQIMEDKIISFADGNSSSYAWKNIDCIRQSKNRIFIYVTKNCAHIIPKNLFETEEMKNEFFETINKKFILHKQ